MAGDLRTFVTEKEVLAVAQQMHGAEVEISDYDVEKGTISSVQGFLSNILRVSFRAKVGQRNVTSKFVVKRKPILESQLSTVDEMQAFENEIGFFKLCAPHLRERCPDLPVVTCYLTDEENSIIYMEDLKESGYVALVRNIGDLKHDILTERHLDLVMRTLAKFHSASLGINWLEKLPSLFKEDAMFTSGAEMIKKFVRQSAEKALVPITEHHFKGNDYFCRSSRWVTSEDFFLALKAICEPDTAGLNVVCHGDGWVNNMMFKLDPNSGKPLSIKLIDFQICRYTPGNRDLMDFLYTVCPVEVRKKNEKRLLRVYWDTFVAECKERGVPVAQDWEKFYQNFDRNRAFGLMMAVCLRPSIFVKGTFPEGDEALTDDHINTALEGGSQVSDMIREFENNPEFRAEMISLIEETAELFYKYYA
ncbi:Hypothetical predicted protein [Cloeon dipterum]|uniref:CHK kinase-like domain-containing protein n=1 Tax=Cloeon dipterum TaxID=197152 RepID=A0A8S1DT86_9INSE|nr:Hypothetical predicted protein [Cloeon dipterum]